MILAFLAPALAVVSPPLHDALLELPFANSDVVHAKDTFAMKSVSSIYLEAEAPLKPRWAWADGRITTFHSHAYLFVKNATANETTVNDNALLKTVIRPHTFTFTSVPMQCRLDNCSRILICF